MTEQAEDDHREEASHSQTQQDLTAAAAAEEDAGDDDDDDDSGNDKSKEGTASSQEAVGVGEGQNSTTAGMAHDGKVVSPRTPTRFGLTTPRFFFKDLRKVNPSSAQP